MSQQSTQSARRNYLRRWTATLREAVATELWPLPTISITIAIILGIVLPLVD